MSAEIIPFELPPAAGRYEIVEITRGISNDLYVALAGPRGPSHRDPWHCLKVFSDGAAADAIEMANSASWRHGRLLIWDHVGIIDPDFGPGKFWPRDNFDGGHAA
ncbi:hypothetical protein [Sphingomonas qomolangmaensis]|uniref:Uncharacterized protein n=1 Tax=Sphingomonas qomolangmaensis TaxID=2918765 RepID=A0ABY5L908_9SPHN|nr:hypothetical protein [Sphingomonas qomolangmaensis]UUL83443.1 hypothetical protein NMP03_04230 [Sphingomonas qomolangmaensis]